MTAIEFHEQRGLRAAARFGALHAPMWFVRLAPRIIGPVLGLLSANVRRAVFANQRRILGGASRWLRLRGALGTLVEFACCLTESLALGRRQVRSEVVVEGAERLDELVRGPAGLVIATAHAGPWDAAAASLRTATDKPILVVMRAETDARAGALQDELRHASGLTVLRLDDDPLSAVPVVMHLLDGGIVALQVDRVVHSSSAMVSRLFGEPFPVPLGPFLLAGLARVPLLPVFSARTGHLRRLIRVGRAVWPSRRPSSEELARDVAEVLGQLEEHLGFFPNQWFHFVPPAQEAKLLREIRPSARRK